LATFAFGSGFTSIHHDAMMIQEPPYKDGN
jgi:hypothetical protein